MNLSDYKPELLPVLENIENELDKYIKILKNKFVENTFKKALENRKKNIKIAQINEVFSKKNIEEDTKVYQLYGDDNSDIYLHNTFLIKDKDNNGDIYYIPAKMNQRRKLVNPTAFEKVYSAEALEDFIEYKINSKTELCNILGLKRGSSYYEITDKLPKSLRDIVTIKESISFVLKNKKVDWGKAYPLLSKTPTVQKIYEQCKAILSSDSASLQEAFALLKQINEVYLGSKTLFLDEQNLNEDIWTIRTKESLLYDQDSLKVVASCSENNPFIKEVYSEKELKDYISPTMTEKDLQEIGIQQTTQYIVFNQAIYNELELDNFIDIQSNYNKSMDYNQYLTNKLKIKM